MESCHLHWRCPKDQWEDDEKRVAIIRLVKWVLAKYSNGTNRVNIRMGPHEQTYIAKNLLGDDPLGPHITAEYQDGVTGMWQCFHLYIVKENGQWGIKRNQVPNPQLFKPTEEESARSRVVEDRLGGVKGDEEDRILYKPVQKKRNHV